MRDGRGGGGVARQEMLNCCGHRQRDPRDQTQREAPEDGSAVLPGELSLLGALAAQHLAPCAPALGGDNVRYSQDRALFAWEIRFMMVSGQTQVDQDQVPSRKGRKGGYLNASMLPSQSGDREKTISPNHV